MATLVFVPMECALKCLLPKAELWSGESVHQPEHLRVFINQLRNKVEPEDEPCYILTDPWVGYRFQPAGAE